MGGVIGAGWIAGREKNKNDTIETSPGRLELPTSRLTVERANQLRHGEQMDKFIVLNTLLAHNR